MPYFLFFSYLVSQSMSVVRAGQAVNEGFGDSLEWTIILSCIITTTAVLPSATSTADGQGGQAIFTAAVDGAQLLFRRTTGLMMVVVVVSTFPVTRITGIICGHGKMKYKKTLF